MVAVLAQKSAPEKSHGRAAPRHFDALETDANADAPAKKKSSPASSRRLRDSDEGARPSFSDIADFSEISFFQPIGTELSRFSHSHLLGLQVHR
jgi:hypothetical protein